MNNKPAHLHLDKLAPYLLVGSGADSEVQDALVPLWNFDI
jgi:hypothetical protein